MSVSSITPGAARCLVWLLLVLTSPSGLADTIPTITIRIASDLSEASLEVPTESLPLVAGDGDLQRRIMPVANAEVVRDTIAAQAPGEPVRLRIRLPAKHSDTVILADWQEWLPVPRHWSGGRPVMLDVHTPSGITVALPFKLVEHSPGRLRYLATPGLDNHRGFSAIGNVALEQFDIGDMVITAALISGKRDAYIDWIETVARAALESHGNAPRRHALIAVVPIDARRSTVPWAHVRRGGGTHIIAYVNEDASRDALVSDWTLFHEMAHLYHPYLRGRDRWLSEGFASYFQYFYQARAGTLDAQRAVDRLWAGFDRGRRENLRYGKVHVTEGGRMRTYWTGAALALELDHRIRRAGEETLATLMGRLAVRALPASQPWTARAYIEALDALLDQPLLAPIYQEVVHSREFPRPTVDHRGALELLTGD
ncbi:MAG: hypothetical protein U5O39_10600 [Gammaproteobacteria bacterium]|nr:hypothetical protein [Gammaproteobacteria bacterium]